MSTHFESTEAVGGPGNAIRRLLRYYPKSFLKLILTGFSLVVLPLIFALIYSAMSIDQLAEQNRKTVYQAEQIAHGSRILVDEVSAMERSVRLSVILGDASLLDGYFRAHTNFEKTAASLSALSLSVDQQQLLDGLRLSDTAIFRKVVADRQSPEALKYEVGDFVPLLDSTRNFLDHGLVLIESEVDAMQERAVRARQIVIWQLLALIPFAMLLASGFSVLITRPIRQIDEAIRHMGQGELLRPVTVNGPEDLRRLGDRLDWMRLRLLELQEQKTKFLQHISHELKTPLTSIREGADLLVEGAVGELSAKQKNVAKILFSNSVQLQKRIEDLLNYSALQTEKSRFVGRQVVLKPLLDGVLRDHDLAIINKNLQIELVCPDILLACDEQKIRIVVDNLLSNAVKFAPSGSRIEVCVSQTVDHIFLDVLDAGPGVDIIDRDKIFNAFYRGQRTPLSTIKGTGLGLSIAREYVLEHGGTIELVAQVGVGAHFRVTLPVIDLAGVA
ncbi:MAG: HAMP domain-containing sensor histidine kinase [Betaproteobacteria bacterium]|nr:HAMP domain-containing sensor histidine kinase [Betaproteobacteria bacterium]